MNPRLRRLESDYRELRLRFDHEDLVTITPIGPAPASKYQVIYRLPSLRLDEHGQPVRTQQTVVTITLPMGYPREKPHAETLDPVFHPNFGAYICIADFWAPGQSLADVVVNIGDMLQFKKYNIRSPLNAIAAEWANENADDLPLADVSLGLIDSPVKITVKSEGASEYV